MFDHAARGQYAVKIPARSKAMTAGRAEPYEALAKVPERKNPEALIKKEEESEVYNKVRLQKQQRSS